MVHVPLSSIELFPLRVEDVESGEMVASLSTKGQLCPIRVRAHPTMAGKFQIIFGNRRVLAAKQLGWETLDAQIVQASDEESLTTAIAENLDRKDFTDFERGLALEKLHEISGKNYSEIAAHIGKSNAFVSQHVAMIRLIPAELASKDEIKKALNSITEKHARVLAKIEDPVERWNMTKLTVKAGFAARELQRFCRIRGSRKKLPRSSRSDEIREVIQQTVQGISSRNISPFAEAISCSDFGLFSLFPPFREMTHIEAKDHLLRILKKTEDFKVRINELHLRNFAGFAFATIRATHQITVAGRLLKAETRATVILQKKETWRIVHEHWSPADFSPIVELVNTPYAERSSKAGL